MGESNTQFEKRKSDHIRIALDPRSQADGLHGLDSVELTHEALPEISFKEVDISASFSFASINLKLSSPIFISSMTAGHEKGLAINIALAKLSDRHQILMGVGSQRRELIDSEAAQEWKKIRKEAPKARLLSNLGLVQLIQSKPEHIQKLIDSTEALAFIVHTNPLQEALQPEGTTDFGGGLQAIEKLVKNISIPVIVKEVGCGFSAETLKRLESVGVFAVDVSGKGGTHWGRVEGYRSPQEDMLYQVAQTFGTWGISTKQAMLNFKSSNVTFEAWASGGVRNGLEVAKLIAMGAQKVGMALPFLSAAIVGDEALDELIKRLEFELKVALFCTGSRNIKDLQEKSIKI